MLYAICYNEICSKLLYAISEGGAGEQSSICYMLYALTCTMGLDACFAGSDWVCRRGEITRKCMQLCNMLYVAFRLQATFRPHSGGIQDTFRLHSGCIRYHTTILYIIYFSLYIIQPGHIFHIIYSTTRPSLVKIGRGGGTYTPRRSHGAASNTDATTCLCRRHTNKL